MGQTWYRHKLGDRRRVSGRKTIAAIHGCHKFRNAVTSAFTTGVVAVVQTSLRNPWQRGRAAWVNSARFAREIDSRSRANLEVTLYGSWIWRRWFHGFCERGARVV